MHSKILLRICQFSLLIHTIDGYVLLAANLEDFKTLARQFVPANLADRIVKLASEPSLPNGDDTDRDDNITEEEGERESEKAGRSDESDERLRNMSVKAKMHTRNEKKTDTLSAKAAIDVEKIIDRVKQRLERDYKLRLYAGVDRNEEYSKQNNNQDKANEYNNEENSKQLKENLKYIKMFKQKGQLDNKTHKDNTNTRPLPYDIDRAIHRSTKSVDQNKRYSDMEDNIEQTVEPEIDEEIFKGVNLIKTNDSYEDYVTPSRENIFEDNTEAFRLSDSKNSKKIHKFPHARKPDFEHTNYKTTLGVKARTEDLVYDYSEVIEVSIEPKTGVSTEKSRKKGTMIPTKEHFKMSSPNYYAQQPVVAEKYDFNEPIPERDREPENLANIGNPPASVNKKVRL